MAAMTIVLDFLIGDFVDSDLMRRPASQLAVGVFDPAPHVLAWREALETRNTELRSEWATYDAGPTIPAIL